MTFRPAGHESLHTRSGGSVMRKALGWLLVFHGLAHAGPGMWATDRAAVWLVTALWVWATVGLMGAGFGLLQVTALRSQARALALIGVFGSVPLLVVLGHPLAAPGLLIDLGIVAAILRWPGWSSPLQSPESRHRWLRRLGTVGAVGLLAYSNALILLRPWYSTWGATRDDLLAVLPGDSLIPDAHYRIDHVISIHAPAAAVWPWLVQIGQDRGGFYSYDWLESAIGADIHNAQRIVPEWQHRQAGDLVRAVPPDWMAGRFGRQLGWRVLQVVPGRALVLQGWGAFVLRPVDSATTRLHVRTRGDGRPILAGVFLAPLGLMVFEPAHFVMERQMLRGFKARAERG